MHTGLPRLARIPIVLIATLGLAACGDDGPGDADISAAIDTYTEGVHASYAASADSANSMDVAIDEFIADPTDANLDRARTAWLAARDDYGPTEAFRFYGGPIDDEATGTEGLINAWPMDESYVDYVEGAPDAGIINDPAGYPTIDADLLVSLNEAGGETNISTGWHAIEFLLWGQDLSLDGAGDRPASDYSSADNADRRGAYLAAASDLLLVHLNELVAAWAPDGDNYRTEFEAVDNEEALRRIITGIGELSRGELAGERMNVAYAERSQEDEHSCFSDNTTNDIIGNARGIQMVLTGEYPGVSGTGILDLVEMADGELATQLESEVQASLAAVEAIPAPFDQHLVDGVSDDDPGRMAVLNGIEHLEDQTDTIVAAADAIGIAINVS
jgi:putative iron-regulated protein